MLKISNLIIQGIAAKISKQLTGKGQILPFTLIQRDEGKLSSCSQLVSNRQNLKIHE